MKKKKTGLWGRALVWGMLSVSVVGFCFFYLAPFAVSFAFSLWDNPIQRTWRGVQNYRELCHNPYFLRGLSNTVRFMLFGIPLNMGASFGVALAVQKLRRDREVFGLLFLIPLALPSSAAAFFWNAFFGTQGTANRMLAGVGAQEIDWFHSGYAMAVMVLIFVWKYLGYDMVLFLSGLSSIPQEYYEYAQTEDAGRWWQFRHITLVYLTPTLFLTGIMTFVNSFKIFKEIYLLTGEYPPQELYVLQHFMNNMFLSLQYPRLASAVYLLTGGIVVIVAVVFGAQHRQSENLYL